MACLSLLSSISWLASRNHKNNTESQLVNDCTSEERVMLSRAIRIAVYLITAILACTSVVVSLVDVNPNWPVSNAPVRIHLFIRSINY